MIYGTEGRTNMPKRIPDIERRLTKLEELSHPPVEWEHKIESHDNAIFGLYERLQQLENKLKEIV